MTNQAPVQRGHLQCSNGKRNPQAYFLCAGDLQLANYGQWKEQDRKDGERADHAACEVERIDVNAFCVMWLVIPDKVDRDTLVHSDYECAYSPYCVPGAYYIDSPRHPRVREESKVEEKDRKNNQADRKTPGYLLDKDNLKRSGSQPARRWWSIN